MINLLTFILGCIIFLFLIYAVIISFIEREKKAVFKLLVFITVIVPLFLLPYILNTYELFSGIIIGITGIFIVILIFPAKGKNYTFYYPKNRIDERNIMFSRAELVPGTEQFIDYYKNNPENLEKDNKFRKNPGLLKKGTSKYNPILFALADASFFTVESLKKRVDGQKANEKTEISPEKITQFIKDYVLFEGAKSCGVTNLKDYHLYSYRGRGEAYGKKIETSHKFAIAFTVEMDKKMTDTAPGAPTVTESARQYLEAGKIAVQIASFIRNMGYSAKAHIDGNYEVVCPLVAKDAGLGEIGRMGLLMTPETGPRVRIAVVTTSLELIPDKVFDDSSLIDFCIQCKKCAVTCPSQAISFTDREKINDVIRWQINQEACYTYWTKTGTDCSKCLQVCPYSHPDNLLHNLVRKGIKHSSIFRKFALAGDDFLYGKKPKAKVFPYFMQIESDN